MGVVFMFYVRLLVCVCGEIRENEWAAMESAFSPWRPLGGRACAWACRAAGPGSSDGSRLGELFAAWMGYYGRNGLVGWEVAMIGISHENARSGVAGRSLPFRVFIFPDKWPFV